jgi:hypothetical protein
VYRLYIRSPIRTEWDAIRAGDSIVVYQRGHVEAYDRELRPTMRAAVPEWEESTYFFYRDDRPGRLYFHGEITGDAEYDLATGERRACTDLFAGFPPVPMERLPDGRARAAVNQEQPTPSVGLMRADGTWLLEPQCTYIAGYHGGFIARLPDGRHGVLDPDGQWLLPPGVYGDLKFLVTHTDSGYRLRTITRKDDELRVNGGPPIPGGHARAEDVAMEAVRYPLVVVDGATAPGLAVYDLERQAWWPRMISYLALAAPGIVQVEDEETRQFRYQRLDGSVIWESRPVVSE